MVSFRSGQIQGPSAADVSADRSVKTVSHGDVTHLQCGDRLAFWRFDLNHHSFILFLLFDVRHGQIRSIWTKTWAFINMK